jgi:uncharacterized protein YicC (UPF0701 family)
MDALKINRRITMQIELSQLEITDIKVALVYTMKKLDEEGNSLNKILADRLEVIEKRLDEVSINTA